MGRLAAHAREAHDRYVDAALYREIQEALGRGEAVALATVTRARGSTPRKPGAKMLIRADGSFTGTIGGGCGEAEVWQEAMATLEDGQPRTVVVDLTEPTDGEDKICGGVMDVFVERLAPPGCGSRTVGPT
ncbi:MAG: sulfurylase small subunit, molybdopterin cytosine dinucleotide biosynthesis [Tepidiforma sp.]|nr:MAG: sulfurylase small subunit, molybdopterin cytosine dinucleotide biosynthesis [Tepidiforma sp.]